MGNNSADLRVTEKGGVLTPKHQEAVLRVDGEKYTGTGNTPEEAIEAAKAAAAADNRPADS